MGSDSISLRTLSFTVLLSLAIFFFFCTEPTLSADSPPSPPPISPSSPQPISPASPSPAPLSPTRSQPPVSPSPFNSPPAPPPEDLAPNSPSPAGEDSPSPSPSPSPVSVNRSRVAQTNASDLESNDDEDGGMSAGKKAGVAVAVIAGVCVVGLGALVYKKRQQNIQRAQYGYAARREFL